MNLPQTVTFRDAVAKRRFETRAFIDGKYVESRSGRTFETLNPATCKVLARVTECDRVDVDAAVAAARRAFGFGVWSGRAPRERKNYTGNLDVAHKMARAIQAGMVSVNCYSEGDMAVPFGGYKESGFGGKDRSLLAHDQCMQTKGIWIQLR